MTSKQTPTQCIVANKKKLTIKSNKRPKKVTLKIKKNKGNKCVLCPRTDCIKKDQWGHWICSDDEDEPPSDDEEMREKTEFFETIVGPRNRPPLNPAGYTTEDEGDVPEDLDSQCEICCADKNLFYTKINEKHLQVLCGSACSENPSSPQYEPPSDEEEEEQTIVLQLTNKEKKQEYIYDVVVVNPDYNFSKNIHDALFNTREQAIAYCHRYGIYEDIIRTYKRNTQEIEEETGEKWNFDDEIACRDCGMGMCQYNANPFHRLQDLYCPDCDQYWCADCCMDFRKARDGEYEGQEICITCFNHTGEE